MLKIQIKSIFGKLLFEHESEKNTLLETLLRANLLRANLEGANLLRANLEGADLRGANLEGANLEGANLEGADLRGANLEGANLLRANLLRADLGEANLLRANLEGADLRGANLEVANLRGADLRGAKNKEFATLPQFCKWPHGIKGVFIKIGCKQKTIADWETFFASDLEFDTKRGTEDFKQIQAVFESYKAYMNFLSE